MVSAVARHLFLSSQKLYMTIGPLRNDIRTEVDRSQGPSSTSGLRKRFLLQYAWLNRSFLEFPLTQFAPPHKAETHLIWSKAGGTVFNRFKPVSLPPRQNGNEADYFPASRQASPLYPDQGSVGKHSRPGHTNYSTSLQTRVVAHGGVRHGLHPSGERVSIGGSEPCGGKSVQGEGHGQGGTKHRSGGHLDLFQFRLLESF